MSVPLHVHGKAARPFARAVLGRVTTRPVPDPRARADHVLKAQRWDASTEASGYAGALTGSKLPADRIRALPPSLSVVHGLPHLDHLEDGDVVILNPNGYVRTLFRIRSQHNALFATDRCNSWCLMCSQPPRPIDDGDRLAEHLRLIDLIDPGCRELGITGGEPTLLKDGLVLLLERCRERLPETALHVLSNGRLFYYGSLARKVAAVEHPDLMIGIPLYSAIEREHDYVVQAKGAYHQTVIGLQNLGRFRVPVEIRVVVHRETYAGLVSLAEFIYRNFPFASHVAFMGLEMMGFAVPNAERLWIDPYDYRGELAEAVGYLAAAGMNVSIFNHQLCTVPRVLWRFCRPSISDWKNEYLPECETCAVRRRCGGFFASSLRRRRSAHIATIS